MQNKLEKIRENKILINNGKTSGDTGVLHSLSNFFSKIIRKLKISECHVTDNLLKGYLDIRCQKLQLNIRACKRKHY